MLKKKFVGIFVCMLLISSSVLTLSGAKVIDISSKPLVKGKKSFNTFYVGGSGSGNYTKIQTAINIATDGDTVFVYDDSSPYYENLIVSKSINLIGENKFTTQINGSGINTKSVIRITADNVTISNFNIENSGAGPVTPDSGIYTATDNNIIENNLITYNKYGICLNPSDGTTISNNIIIRNNKKGSTFASGYGINIMGNSERNISHNLISTNGYNIGLAYTSNDIIYKNEIINATRHNGIWAQFIDNTTFIKNNISFNLGRGIDIYNGSYNNISYNMFIGNGWGTLNGTVGADGISLRVNSQYNIVRGNLVSKNKYDGMSIYRDDCNYNLIVENDIVDNERWGIEITPYYPDTEMFNTVYHNNFINNTVVNAIDKGINIWNDLYPSGGNYWDDYTGEDNNSDGIGDTPYYLPEGDNNTDNFPLMNPWNTPPYVPYNPSPYDGETSVTINTELYWKGGDKIPGDVTYDIYFGTSSTPPKVKSNHSSNNYNLEQLDLTTTYYWKIVAWDIHGAKTEGPIWYFTTGSINNTPPAIPSDPYPENNESEVDIDIDNISWTGGDPDNDSVHYDVYFGRMIYFHKVSSNQSANYYDPSLLSINKTYYWRIITWDEHGDSTIGPLWCFTTRDNEPPSEPYDPEPEDNEFDVDLTVVLHWSCDDPDGDSLWYNVYFEAEDSTPDELVSENQSWPSYDPPGILDYGTDYYWKIVAWDALGASTAGPIWEFTTVFEPNDPPYMPGDPDPVNGSVDVYVDADLNWTGGDPDEEDTVVYDVYLEVDDPTPDVKVADNISESWFDPGLLEYESVYYWQVVAIDNHYSLTEGPIWNFATETVPIPDLTCFGSLSWLNVEPGSVVEGNFTVKNIGEPYSLLNWNVSNWPEEWGEWTFNPVSGNNLLTEDGEVIINVSVIAPNKQNSDFSGNITIVNNNNTDDFCTIDVSLITPKNKSFNFNFNLLNWLFERFPNAFPILRQLLRM